MAVVDSIEVEDDACLTNTRKVQDRCLLCGGTVTCATDNTWQRIHDDVTAQWGPRQGSLTRLASQTDNAGYPTGPLIEQALCRVLMVFVSLLKFTTLSLNLRIFLVRTRGIVVHTLKALNLGSCAVPKLITSHHPDGISACLSNCNTTFCLFPFACSDCPCPLSFPCGLGFRLEMIWSSYMCPCCLGEAYEGSALSWTSVL